MQRAIIAFLLMAAAALPRMGNPISVRADFAPEESAATDGRELAEQVAQPACCGLANHMARLLCLHRQALNQMDQSARAERIVAVPE